MRVRRQYLQFCYKKEMAMERDEPLSAHLSFTAPFKAKDIPITHHHVDTVDKLQEMIKALKTDTMIGVEVEIHSYRSHLIKYSQPCSMRSQPTPRL